MHTTAAIGLLRRRLGLCGPPASGRAIRARVVACLWLGGSVLLVLSSQLPHRELHPRLLSLAVPAALVLGLLVLAVYERLPDWGIHLQIAGATVLVTVLAHLGGLQGGLYASPYLWIVLYAGYFLTVRAALAHFGLVAVAYAFALVGIDPYTALIAWLLRIVTLATPLLLVLFLKGRVDGLVVERARSDEELRQSREQMVKLSAREIDERRRTQVELERSLSLQRATLESTGDGILVVGADGRISSYNQKFCELWGLPEDGLLGERRQDALAGAARLVADPDAFIRVAGERYADPRAFGLDTIELADGRVFERYTQPQRLGDEIVGRVWSFRDVTERRRAEEALQRSQEQLLQAQKMEAVGRLAGGVAHDFNNLLTAIGGYAELLHASLPEDDPLHRDAEEICSAAARAATLTRQLLAFSRRQLLQPAPLQLDDVVAGVESMLRRLIGEDVELVAVPAAGLWTVRADPGQLEQVLVNLAVNARDAMPLGGRLTLETANVVLGPGDLHGVDVEPGEYVRLTVTDTGVGMSPEVVERVFEPFYTTKELGRGTGLGLSSVLGIVEQSGGFVSAYSEVGVGSCFKVHLPRAEAEAAGGERPADEEPAVGGRETILLVEDETTVRALAERVLRRAGYRVLEAPDGKAALELAAEHASPIDLVVSDVVMPRMGGRLLAQAFAETRPQTRFLFMSGYTGEAVSRHGVLDPGDAFIGKPFRPEALVRKVREVLDAA